MLNVRERRAAQAKHEIVELIGRLGEARTATALNVHLTTVRRWYDGRSRPPAAVLIALRALVYGQLPGMELRHWEGWTFSRDGKLYSPSNEAYSAGDIMAMQYERQLIKHLQRQVDLLREKLRNVETGAANDAVAGELTG